MIINNKQEEQVYKSAVGQIMSQIKNKTLDEIKDFYMNIKCKYVRGLDAGNMTKDKDYVYNCRLEILYDYIKKEDEKLEKKLAKELNNKPMQRPQTIKNNN